MKDEKRKEKPVYNLKTRTKQFALTIISFYTSLPNVKEAQVIGKQLLRSGTSVGAHYRESIRSRSNAEFISKLQGGLQELEETMYWIELLTESNLVTVEKANLLLKEANELMAIITTCVKKVKNSHRENDS
jgi:four helix bundle protein